MRLELRGVSRSFGALQALEGASFTVEPGTVHGIIGPNGAGKTTLLNIISGVLGPSSGEVVLGGRRIDGLPPHRVAALGLTRTFQNIRLFPALSAVENVLVGQHRVRRAPLGARLLLLPSAARERQEATGRARALLDRVGIRERAEERSSNLSYGDQRRVEIARALSAEPRLLLLDEPTAGMNPVEASGVGTLIREVASAGVSVVLIEHNVRLVMDLCTRVTVLNFGRVIADGTPAAVSVDPAVITAYLGAAR
ncbi:MAG TPA: ABC transporter ATP-binding protein [Myxococcaceae bacterium]|jgi:ABC-type branched-subunit amino acid transport system ATPase component|nr:ABC transporter ATP-binding protein [Myxococcaceae bacterium]